MERYGRRRLLLSGRRGVCRPCPRSRRARGGAHRSGMQNFHVRHRLERYGAGRRMDFELDGPAEIATAIAEEIGREVD
jgi:hypothetical protein